MGSVVARLILDGSTTSKAITLPSTHHIKRIRAAVGQGTVASDGIGAAGVAATTGFTLTVAAGTNGHALDVLLVGDGKL